jgi:uncharacterized protein YfbU (UPF0304 family)
MDLSETERLILLNQYTIFKLLDPEEKQGDWEDRIRILESQYTRLYDRFLMPPHQDPPPDDVYSLVHKALDLYRAIQDSTATFDKGHEIDTAFPGFYGNYEMQYLSIAAIEIRMNPSYHGIELKDSPYGPMIQQYEKMISLWKTYGDRASLSREQVLALLNA